MKAFLDVPTRIRDINQRLNYLSEIAELLRITLKYVRLELVWQPPRKRFLYFFLLFFNSSSFTCSNSERHSTNLEWGIIALIAVEILFEVLHFVERHLL